MSQWRGLTLDYFSALVDSYVDSLYLSRMCQPSVSNCQLRGAGKVTVNGIRQRDINIYNDKFVVTGPTSISSP